MNGAVARIVLRVLAGFLVGAGWATEETANYLIFDPDVQMAVGGLIWAATEFYYSCAKKKGWPT